MSSTPEFSLLIPTIGRGNQLGLGKRETVMKYYDFPDEKQQQGALLDQLDQEGNRYLLRVFNSETCRAIKPSFHLDEGITWFYLLYSKRANLLD